MADKPVLKIITRCPNCSSNNYTLPNNFQDESIAVCSDCGTELGPIGKLREAGREMGRKRIREELKNAFAKRPNK
jgi:hypothetical protein